MAYLIFSAVTVFTVIGAALFLVFKSECVTLPPEEVEKLLANGSINAVKVYIRRDFPWKKNSLKAKSAK